MSTAIKMGWVAQAYANGFSHRNHGHGVVPHGTTHNAFYVRCPGLLSMPDLQFDSSPIYGFDLPLISLSHSW